MADVKYEDVDPTANWTRVSMTAEGTVVRGNPVMPGRNPHPIWTLDWYVWKEQNEAWVPYHMGMTPGGTPCSSNPRVQIVRPGMYRCPACGKEFPTFTADLAAKQAAEGGA